MADVLGTPPAFWMWREDLRSFARFERLCARDYRLGVQNQLEMADAEARLKRVHGWVTAENHALPDGFPAPRLALPKKGFSPDYFVCGPFHFASGKLREVMAQPAGVVQWAPVELVAGGEEARAQDYRWGRVLAFQPAIDLGRSECTTKQGRDIVTGAPTTYATWVDRYVLLEGLRARTDVFNVEETYATVLVTDALAERMLQAGCTGVAFRDPTVPQQMGRPRRFRTAAGVRVER